MQHWHIPGFIFIQVLAMVKCVPAHTYSDELVRGLEDEINASAVAGGQVVDLDKGKGKGKLGADVTATAKKGPSGWLEKCAALAVAVQRDDLEMARAWVEEFGAFGTFDKSVQRCEQRGWMPRSMLQ